VILLTCGLQLEAHGYAAAVMQELLGLWGDAVRLTVMPSQSSSLMAAVPTQSQGSSFMAAVPMPTNVPASWLPSASGFAASKTLR